MCAMKQPNPSQIPSTGTPPYTYADYLEWPDEERWEIIEGVPYSMTPAPSRLHQKISSYLHGEIYAYLKEKHSDCELYAAPFDVRLPELDNETSSLSTNQTVSSLSDKHIFTVVQPDISIICDKSKLDDKGCLGAPDFIIEIVSPSTAAQDYIRKVTLYEKHGVKEYWIVHPTDKIVTVYLLKENQQYSKPTYFTFEDEVGSSVLDGLALTLIKGISDI